MGRNFVLTAAALLLLAAEANAGLDQGKDLTGTWSGNDSGIYYIHQLGTVVWWYGEQARTGPAWGNVAHGRFQDDRLILEWADVPKGQIMSSGELILTIDSPNHLTAVHRTGGFAGSVWIRR
jgi:hypothetical protein